MAQFRKKPVEIEAMQFKGIPNPLGETGVADMDYLGRFDDWIEKVRGATACKYRGGSFYIQTLEGEMEASPGDWIIRGVKGELYPCKPEIFAATYDPVDTPQHLMPDRAA